MGTRAKSIRRGMAEDQAAWRRVYELLMEARYKSVIDFLHQMQLEYEHTGNVIVAEILAAMHQICLVCDQFQVGAEWHRQASEEANRREQELRQHLCAILELIVEKGMLEAPMQPVITDSLVPGELRSSVSSMSPFLVLQNFWQRVQDTLGWSSSPQIGRPEASTDGIETVVPLAIERAEAPAAPIVEVGAEPGRKKANPPSLVIYCLGSFRIYQDQNLITNWSGGKGKAIFKYLVANRSRPIHKDVLMDLFWRNADLEAARNNLNVAIHSLRQTFKAIQPNFSCILFHEDHYRLDPAITIWVDFEHFNQAYQAGRRLEKQGQLAEAIRAYELAEGLYQGDFLEEDPYEDWPIIQRESLKDSYLVILERLSRYYFEEKRYATCIHLCQKILAKDDCREDAHRRLMQCYSCQGQLRLALRQYHLCVEALHKVLEVTPAPETVALYNQIRARKEV